jgi:hypothetical protein
MTPIETYIKIRRILCLHEKGPRRVDPHPTHSRPSLEPLEQRTLLSVAPSIFPDPVVTSPQLSSGFVAAQAPFVPNSTSATAQAPANALGQANSAVASSLPSQDQLNSQFRDFGVNSQGGNNQLYQALTNILFDVYGFGSGVMPNAPWMPAAYNLGLANNQFGYSLQSDLGY